MRTFDPKLFMKQNREQDLNPRQILNIKSWTDASNITQVKSVNNSQNVLNEIRKIVYFWHQSKEIIKKVYNNIIKSIQL